MGKKERKREKKEKIQCVRLGANCEGSLKV